MKPEHGTDLAAGDGVERSVAHRDIEGRMPRIGIGGQDQTTHNPGG
jgi:hypothetical protein